MIRTTKILLPALGAALSLALAGCGGNEAANTAASTGTTVTVPETSAPSTSNATTSTTDKDGSTAAPAELAAFFPGAQLVKKPITMNAELAKHMSGEAGVTFSGKEGEWEIYDATQNGARVGMGVLTHSDLPGGGDMHIAFAVDKNFKVTQTAVSEAPDVAKMKTFIAQTVGKNHDAPFKVGKDLKATPGLAAPVAQVAADAVHKGVVILEENFNPSHGEHEHSH